jgi:hypothetical protein
MKTESEHDQFETESWQYKVISDPYQVIAEAFSTADVAHFRSYIKQIMHYAEIEQIYKGESPCTVLLLKRVIRSLIKAANSLREIKSSPISVLEHDAFNQNYYCSHFLPSCAWDEFPRFLSINEYCNPYKVFRKFFKYQGAHSWLHDLREIVDCALSKNNGELGLEMIAIYSHLVKLVEAAHLINVREVTHIEGRLKNKAN